MRRGLVGDILLSVDLVVSSAFGSSLVLADWVSFEASVESSSLEFMSSGTEFCFASLLAIGLGVSISSGVSAVFEINFCSKIGVLIGLLSFGDFAILGKTSSLEGFQIICGHDCWKANQRGSETITLFLEQ